MTEKVKETRLKVWLGVGRRIAKVLRSKLFEFNCVGERGGVSWTPSYLPPSEGPSPVKSQFVPALMLALVASIGAAPTGPRPAGTSGSGARIVGAAWNSDSQPIPNASLRLRNVVTGRIEATTIANSAGQFTFENVKRGSYVIEMVTDSGKVIALGHTFAVAPGETVATFVRLASKLPWFSALTSNGGLFSNA